MTRVGRGGKALAEILPVYSGSRKQRHTRARETERTESPACEVNDIEFASPAKAAKNGETNSWRAFFDRLHAPRVETLACWQLRLLFYTGPD